MDFIDQPVEKKSADPMCMLDDITYIDYLPKYDQYDDDYVVEIKVDSSRKSTTCFWEEEVQLQLFKYSTQPMHISHDTMNKIQKISKQVKGICLYVSLHFNF